MANWKHAAEVAQQHKQQSMENARTIMEAIKLYPCDHIEDLKDLEDVRHLLRDAYEWHKRWIRYSRKAFRDADAAYRKGCTDGMTVQESQEKWGAWLSAYKALSEADRKAVDDRF